MMPMVTTTKSNTFQPDFQKGQNQKAYLEGVVSEAAPNDCNGFGIFWVPFMCRQTLSLHKKTMLQSQMLKDNEFSASESIVHV